MSAWFVRTVLRDRLRRRQWFGALLAVALALGFLALGPAPSALATTPKPAPQSAPAVSGSRYGAFDVFYRSVGDRLMQRSYTEGWEPAQDLGGVLRSGPGAITIGGEFAITSVFARGADDGVW